MIKAMVYYDGSLTAKLCDYLAVDEIVKDLFKDLEMFYISGEFGYTANRMAVMRASALPSDFVIFTNSLHVLNNEIAKEQCSEGEREIRNIYILINNKVLPLQRLTAQEIRTFYTLDKMYTNGGFELLEELKK